MGVKKCDLEAVREKNEHEGRMKRTYGYVRVSSQDQILDRQIKSMRDYGIPDKMIFREKMSGKDFERPEYHRLLRKLRPGDTLVIKSIDRLGRNYDEILEHTLVFACKKI